MTDHAAGGPRPVDPTLADLEGRLRSLPGLPVGSHPDVLEEVQRAIVAELDELASGFSGPGGHDQGRGNTTGAGGSEAARPADPAG